MTPHQEKLWDALHWCVTKLYMNCLGSYHIKFLVKWALSQDNHCQETGTQTGIGWLAQFEAYLAYPEVGLVESKASVLHIFQVWDKTLFPHSEKNLGSKSTVTVSSTESSTRDVLAALATDETDETLEALGWDFIPRY